MYVTLDHSIDLTPNTRSFYFVPSMPFVYQPGQFVSLHVPHDNPDNRGVHRWFTLSSAPNEQWLSVTTTRSEGGSSYKQALWRLTAGARVAMQGPLGTMTLPADSAHPLVWVAGGIGITPFRSMAQWLTTSRQSRSIQLMQAVTTQPQLLYQDIFTAAGVVVIPIISQPSVDWAGWRGPLDAQHLVRISGTQPNTLYMLAGPKPMVRSLATELQSLGVPVSAIRSDEFSGYA